MATTLDDDRPLKIARWTSLGLIALALIGLTLPLGEIVSPWLFTVGLISWVTFSLVLGWRETKRKEAAR